MKYYIYCLMVENDKIQYIGITIKPPVRESEHKRTKPPHIFKILEESEDVKTASLIEESLVTKHNTYVDGWNKPPGGDYFRNSGYRRKGIGGVKKGTSPWNKGKINCFSEKTIKKFKQARKGKIHSSKLSENTIKEIRSRFDNHPTIDKVNSISPNGIKLTQERAFSNTYCSEYNITATNLHNIIIGKSWKNLN